MDVTELDRDQKVAAAGSVVVLASGLFPWVGSAGGFDVTPGLYDAVTIGLGVVALGLLALWDRRPLDQGLVLLLGAITTVYSAYRFVDPLAFGGPPPAAPPTAVEIEPGVGTYLGLAGGILLLTAALLALFADTPDRP